MIYFTTFILALFLPQIARALPQACGEVIIPELPTPVDQYNFPIEAAAPLETVVIHNHKYDDPNASTNTVACKILEPTHHRFHNFPAFPRIGGAFDIGHSSGPNCGKCWRLHNVHNNHSIHITAIGHANHGFSISEHAFKLLSNGNLIPELKHVRYYQIPDWECL